MIGQTGGYDNGILHKAESKAEAMKRHRGRNRHHILPRRRGGNSHKENLLLIDERVHVYWHKVFGLRTIGEVIKLLERIERAKRRQRYT